MVVFKMKVEICKRIRDEEILLMVVMFSFDIKNFIFVLEVLIFFLKSFGCFKLKF